MSSASPIVVARLRTHPSAVEIGHGWLLLADTNVFDNVYLVSKHTNTIVSFIHGKPYHSHLRAYCEARVYAEDHPEAAPALNEPQLVFAPLFGLIT